jgi:hypothetical protein
MNSIWCDRHTQIRSWTTSSFRIFCLHFFVLDSEDVTALIMLSVIFLIVGPIPLCFFIEDHISCDCDLPGDWIIGLVGFCSPFIPNEDHLSSPIIQLLWVRLGVAHIDDAVEGSQVMHCRPLAMPGLDRRHAIHCLAQYPVQEVDDDDHRLPTKLVG